MISPDRKRRVQPASQRQEGQQQETHVMSMMRDMKSRASIFGELWAFMKVRKKWWLGPIMIFLLLLGVLIVFTEGSALAPFIYALF
jgi:hypothetical protein